MLYCYQWRRSSAVSLTYVILVTMQAETRKTEFRPGVPNAAVRLIVEWGRGPVFGPAWGGSRVSGRKRPKCLFLQRFAVGRAFLEPGRSVSRFSKPQSRGQRQYKSAKRGGSEGFNSAVEIGDSFKDSLKQDLGGRRVERPRFGRPAGIRFFGVSASLLLALYIYILEHRRARRLLLTLSYIVEHSGARPLLLTVKYIYIRAQ